MRIQRKGSTSMLKINLYGLNSTIEVPPTLSEFLEGDVLLPGLCTLLESGDGTS